MRQTIQHLRGTDTLDITKAKSAKMLLGEIAVKNGSGGTSELYVLSSDGNSLDTFVNKNYIDSKINELSELGSYFINGGVINITRSGSVESVFDELPSGGVSICIIGDSSGSYPSNPSNGVPETRVNVNSKYKVLDNYFFSEHSIGANVGDILVINKQTVSNNDKCILKIIPLSDAKLPTETYAGTNGVFTFNDKQKLSKIDEIESLSIENTNQIEENANVTASALNDLNDRLNEKQNNLISGLNIKTINGESILGEGDIVISSGETVDLSGYFTKDEITEQFETIENVNNLKEIVIEDEYIATEAIIDLNKRVNLKQDTLVDGETIKTINGESILGEGNIELVTDLSEYYKKNEIDVEFDTVKKIIRDNENVTASAFNDLKEALSEKQNALVDGETIKTINGESVLGNGNIEINASTLGLSAALKYCGITTTELSDGSTDSIIIIGNAEHSAEEGCVVFYGDKEFVYNGSVWNELGYPSDLSNYYDKNEIDSKFALSDDIVGIKTIIKDNENVIASSLNNLKDELTKKQNILIDGETIKTINGETILGKGDIVINTDVDLSNYYDKSESDSIFVAKEYVSELEKSIYESEKITSLSLNDLNLRVNNKVEKEEGKQLSDENFTSELKNKLEQLSVNATDNVQSDWNETDKTSDAFILNKPESLKNPSSLKFGNKSYDGSNEIEITVSDLGLSSALKYCGVTTTKLVDGSTVSSIIINSTEHIAEQGCVVFYEDKEFVFNGSVWNELGYPSDLSNYYDKNEVDNEFDTVKTIIRDNENVTASAFNDLNEKINNNNENIINSLNELNTNFSESLIKLDGRLDKKQDTLVSGENIKTFNGESILGEGNIEFITDLTNYFTKEEVESKINELKDIVIEDEYIAAEAIIDLNKRVNSKQDALVDGETIKTINGDSILGEGNIEINASTLGLSAALKYCGVTTTELVEGSTTNIIIIEDEEHTAESGCVVFYGDKEFIFNGSVWNELGYPVDLNGKQDTITDLDTIRSNSELGATAYNSLSDYYKKNEIDVEFDTVKKIIKDNENVTASALNELKDGLSEKQDIIIGGENIKNVNGYNIVGEGEIIINASDIKLSNDYKSIDSYEGNIELTPISNEDTVDSAFSTIEGNLSDLAKKVAKNELVSANALTNLDVRVNNKQDILVDGENIKTINGESILGNGNIDIDISEALTQSAVTTMGNSFQRIASKKNFDEGIGVGSYTDENGNIQSKTLISSTIDNGELKVFSGNTTNGFIIRTKDVDSNDLPSVELLATNTHHSYIYKFPALENGNDSELIALNKDIVNLEESLTDKEFVAAQAINDLNANMKYKQDILVDGKTIKTINGSSILGEGNIEINADINLDEYYKKSEIDGEFTSIKDIIKNNENVIASAFNDINKKIDEKQYPSIDIENINTSIITISEEYKVIEDYGANIPLTSIQTGVSLDSAINTIETNISDVAKKLSKNEYVVASSLTNLDNRINEKQDILVDGETIKTIDGESILGEGNFEISNKYTTKEETSNLETELSDKEFVAATAINELNSNLKYKQDILVSGTNLKTINGETLLGGGNIEISTNVDLSGYFTKDEITEQFETIENVNNLKEIVIEDEYIAAEAIIDLNKRVNSKQDTLVDGETIKTINGDSILGEGNIEINASTLGLSAALKYCGITTTELADGSTISNITINEEEHIAESGCMVFYGDKEFIFNGSVWNELGYPVDLNGKQDTITDLDSIRSNSELGATAYNSLSDYYKKQEIDTEFDTVKKIIKDNENVTASALNELKISINETDNNLTTAIDILSEVKQDTLVSGENIKTINGVSVLGEGDIEIKSDLTEVENKINNINKTIEDNEYVISVVLNKLNDRINDLSEKITDIYKILETLTNK